MFSAPNMLHQFYRIEVGVGGPPNVPVSGAPVLRHYGGGTKTLGQWRAQILALPASQHTGATIFLIPAQYSPWGPFAEGWSSDGASWLKHNYGTG